MRQLRALVALRWQMVRDPRVRRGLLLLALALPLLVVIGGAAGQVARDTDLAFNILLLTPSLFLGFAVLTVLAPLSSGGGNELFPTEQLVAFPMEARTSYLGSLASAPLNLAWATQVVSLVAATSLVADQTPLVLLSLVTTLCYIALATTAGQALGWWVVGIRQKRVGRLATRAIGTGAVVGIVAVVATGHGVALLDRSPTTAVTIAAVQGSQARFGGWASVTAGLALGTVLAYRAGGRAATWALRQPGAAQETSSHRMARRPDPSGHLAALLRVDRGSVIRSVPLRRGLVVLGLLPGAVAAAARVDWASIALLPGLVAAGSGLLFGVNTFCLDASGGVWLASLPHAPRAAALAKTRVIAETCLVAELMAVAAASTTASRGPTAAEVSALACAIVTLTAMVVSTCLRLSVERPHRADLRGPRDAPAPPATMAVYSLRLALSTTFTGALFVGAAASGLAVAGPLLAVVPLLLVTRSVRRSLRLFDSPAVRARVVTVVAAG